MASRRRPVRRPAAPLPAAAVRTTSSGTVAVFGILLPLFVLLGSFVEAEVRNDDRWKITYVNETEDLNSRFVAEKYRDKLVQEHLKIIIENEKASVVHYVLPMDAFQGRTIVNPSRLEATVSGNPGRVAGILGSAIQVDGRDSFVRVAGSGHRSECFGDLDRCSVGYTLSSWVKFDEPLGNGEHVFVSNGGHHQRSHGVALLYNRGKLEFRFRKKNGQEWRAESGDVLPGRWYHVVGTWGPHQGLTVYINGELTDTSTTPVVRSPLASNTTEFNEFIIGRPNDNSNFPDRRTITIDEFNFWSEFKSPEEVKELGPMYRYYLPMDVSPGLNAEDGNMKVVVGGDPSRVRGKMSGALEFDGRQDFITGQDQLATCLGNLTLCRYGVAIGAWVRFDDLRDSYVLSTGNRGVKLYLRDNRLVAEAQQGNRHWTTSWSAPEVGRWHFIELAWSPSDGLGLYADLKEVARETRYSAREPSAGSGLLQIGKSGQNLRNERYAAMAMDELELWYGNRNQLVDLDFIARGRPTLQQLAMDAASSGRIPHPNITIETFGRPRMVEGKVGNALYLDGNSQYVSLGDQHRSCLGNLDRCPHGLLLSSWIRPGRLQEGMDLLSSGTNGLRAWFSGGRLHVTARTTTKEWALQTDKLTTDQWQFVEFGWDPKDGLAVYVDDQLVAQDTDPSPSDYSRGQPDEKFYIGRGDGSRSSSYYANMTIDDVEYWYNNRKYLLAFDYIRRGKQEKFHLDMDNIRDNKLVHASLNIPVYGDPTVVAGKVNNAVQFNGNHQYLDAGDHSKTCLGNMEHCTNGLTGSLWVKFRSLRENAYYLSSGGGLRVYYSDGKLWVVVDRSGFRWEVGIADLGLDTWYFVEYTWHPDRGLQVYVDNKLVGEFRQGSAAPLTRPTGRYLIGSANSGDATGGRFQYADAVIDEVETWFLDRDSLVAFGYLHRENISHIVFPLENQRGTRITHPDYVIVMYNGAALTPGKIGNGVNLGGNGEYVTFGDQQRSCMGNLERCHRGLTISMYLNPKTLPDNGYILSSGPYSIYSKDGKVFVKFTSGTKTWEVETNRIRLNDWQKVEVSWDEQKGLQLYVNKEKVASTAQFTVLPRPPRVTDYTVYLGRPNEDTRDGTYANAKIDELEFWFANRDLIKIDDDVHNVIVDMNQITGNTLVHPSRVIQLVGGARLVTGTHGTGVLLNGQNQYIDVGGREVFCAGELDNCPRGFTLRFKISPRQLVENTYFVSSAPLDVYYQDNRLTAEVRTPRNVWRTSTGNLERNAWYQVELSWHPVDGLAMYVNGQRVDQQTTASRNYAEYAVDRRFYVGRANTEMRYEYYADAVFDDLQIWEAKRDYLIAAGLVRPDEDVSGWATSRPRPTPAPTQRPRPAVTFPANLPGYRQRLRFDGDDWVMYDFDQLPSEYLQRSDTERLMIKFRSDRPDGLLWYTGDDHNNVHLTLKDGFLYLVSTRDGGRDIKRIRIASSRLNDNAWHNVVLTKRDEEISTEVDGNQYSPHSINSDFSFVRPARVYLGGSSDTNDLTNSHISSNFYGRIREALISGNSLPGDLDLKGLYLLRPSLTLVRPSGEVITEEDDDEMPKTQPSGKQPITFVTKHSHLRLPAWTAVQRGTLEFSFRTVEPTGLILFSGSQGRSDFIAVEIYDAILYLVINLGSSVQRFPFSGLPIDNGARHYARIERDGRNLRLTLDNEERPHTINGTDTSLELGAMFFVGGVDHKERLPWHVWTGDAAGIALGEDRKYFRGCLWDLKMNGQESIDLESYVQQQKITGIELGCRPVPVDCETNPCHVGTCTERFNGFFCDCSQTNFTGKRCELVAPFVAFSGQQYLRVNVQPTYRSHTNDISLRFKTLKENGLLFETSNRAADDRLSAMLENGRVKVETNLGGSPRPTSLNVDCRFPLNDDRWHTLHVKRRAHYLEAYVDSCTKSRAELPGEGYGLNIDDILVGKRGVDDSVKNSFVGYLQNFYFDKYRFFDYFMYGGQPADIRFGGDYTANLTEIPLPVHSVTLRQSTNAYLALPTLQILGDTSIRLMFRTRERDGLLMYSGGLGGDFFAVTLVNGVLHVSANDGGGARLVTSPAPFLGDNRWHLVDVIQTGSKKFKVTVDGTHESTLLLPESRDTLDLSGSLYVGGVPENVQHRLPSVVESRRSFVGCLASLYIDGRLYNLVTDVTGSSTHLIPGCSDVTGYCSSATCGHRGTCHETVDGYYCDCNMTSYVGRLCSEEAKGYYFGDRFEPGISVFTFDRQDTSSDRIALGFMTWKPDGTLIRLDSDTSADFIEAKLINGHVVVMYDLGDGVRYLNETRQYFNDGRYHYMVFRRSGDNATLQIDDFPVIRHLAEATGSVIFTGVRQAKIGGNLDRDNQIVDYFNGIVSGVYVNGYRVVDLNVDHRDRRIVRIGDTLIAAHPFHVPRSTWPRPTLAPSPPPTAQPPGPPTPEPPVVVTLPPEPPTRGPFITPGPPPTGGPPPPTGAPPPVVIPPGPGGGGVGWGEPGGGGGGGDGMVVMGGSGDPKADPLFGPPPVGGAGVEEGARAAAVAGAMIGILALGSSAIWAFYKFKPGLIGAGAGGGAPKMVISNPSSTTIPLLPVGGAGAGGGGASGGALVASGAGAGGSAGGGAAAADGFLIKSSGLSGTGGGGGGGGGAVNLSEHFRSISSSVTANGVGGSGGGGAGFGGGTINRGIQTESALAAGGGGGGAAAAGAQDQTISRSTYIQQDIRNVYNVNQDAGYGTGQGQGTAAQGMATLQGQAGGGYASGYGSSGQAALQQGFSSMSSSSYAYGGSQGYGQGDRVDAGGYRGVSPQGYGGYGDQSALSSTTGNVYEIQNMALGYSGISQQELLNQQRMAHQRLVAASSGAGGAPVPNLMAAEEIRVDCAKMTTNGRYVVTGSIFGPPQVWDLKTGDLVRIMKGEDFSSTDLHLANGDTLLVGQVAELEQINPTDPTAVHRLHQRKLQIWDFESGHPLDMRRNELCTASCMMNDGERMLLGRTDKYGKNTVIIVWDILGNEQIRQITCDASVGFADYISYLNLSKDSRYVIAGFQNSHDHKANFITFDLSSSSAAAASPKIIALDANVEVTAILENHEAVTGTKGGELIIWSVRTARELRQLVSPPPGGTVGRRDAYPLPAHGGEVKDVVVSKDGLLLVSASADRTLRVWNMELEKLIHILVGHADEVWCCTISNDNELVVSGSRDCTIRLWRTEDGQQMAAIDAGMDVFKVLLSNNKQTIVALADRAASRKLIMLKVVRNKIKGSSRATSPRWHDGSDVF